jgi:hypothetical protein
MDFLPANNQAGVPEIESFDDPLAPPSSSAVTTSLVTVFTTSGPVTNM